MAIKELADIIAEGINQLEPGVCIAYDEKQQARDLLMDALTRSTPTQEVTPMSENEQKYGFHRHVRHAAAAVGYGTEADLTPAPTAPVERMAAAAEQLDYAVSMLEAMVERLIEGDHVPVEHTNKEPRRAPYMSPMHALRNAPDEMSAAAARVQRLQERLLEAFISE